MDLEPTVTITTNEYTKLLKRDEWLTYLEQAGVDNWEGYSYAQELRDKEDAQ